MESSARVVVVECGGGLVIPSVRCEGELLLEEAAEEGSGMRATLVRLNPTDFAVPQGGIGIPLGAAAAMRAIRSEMAALS